MMLTQDVTENHTNSAEIELKLKEKCINSDVEVIPLVVEELNSDKVTNAKNDKHLEVDIIEKENKKHRKLNRRRKNPDPAVINISELMSSSLRIISPEKSGNPTMLSDLDDLASNEGLGVIVEKELNKSFDCDLNKLNSSIEEEVGNNLNQRRTRKKSNRLSLKDSPQCIKDEDKSQRNLNSFLQINLQKERTESNVTLSTNSNSSDGKRKSNEKENKTKQFKNNSLRKSEVLSVDSKGDVSSEIENSLEKSCEEILEDLSAFADNENSSKDKSEDSLKQPSPKQNVFNFMMDQRSKSIGMNYDGKPNEESPNNENSEVNLDSKKNEIAKRKGKFEEWNNKKGLKRKQVEEEREEYCHAVLEHRSKKLKKMLSITPKKNGMKRKRVRRMLSSESNSDASSDIISPPNIKKPKDCLTLIEDTLDVEVFKKHTHTDSRTNKVQKGLLSFFGVLDTKKVQSENIEVTYDDEQKSESQSTIKVKMFSPKVNRKRNVLNVDESSIDQISNENSNKVEEKRERLPRKARLATKVAVIEESSNDQSSNCSVYSESESNHSVKPRKPRKSKKEVLSLSKMKAAIKLKMDNNVHIDLTETVPERRSSGRVKVAKNYNEEEDNSSTEQKKKVKVAPIFHVKPKVDPKVLEARMNFLRSGIPEKIKKQIEKPPEIEFDIFPKISHVLQNDPSDPWNAVQVTMKFEETKTDLDLNFDNFKFESLTNSKDAKQKIINLNAPNRNLAFKNCVLEIKEANPEYPVNKFFRILHEKSGYNVVKEVVNAIPSPPKVKKRGRPKKKVVEEKKELETKTSITLTYDDRMWTEKYKSKCSDDIIGNQKSVNALKSWLVNWIQFTEEVGKVKKTYRRDSSDFETSDNESRDGGMPGNGMILRGSTSSGKTSSLYAICNELNINVIELNASSKRTGKRLLRELQEATQSHQVRKRDNNPLSSFLNKKKLSADKVESSRKMCILLVEDVDIVFDQDEGFLNALSQLLTTSKRPIVLTMSDVDCSHLHKFTSQYPVLIFNPLSARSLGVWLQILCLVEGLKVDLGSLSELLEWNKGDIRRTLMQLQFWGQTGGDCSNSRSNAVSYIRSCNELEKLNKSDDYSHEDTNEASFLQDDEAAAVNKDQVHKNCIGTFLVHEIDEFSLPYPIDLGNVWWNLPTILHINPINHNTETRDNTPEVKEDLEKLESIANVFDAMSVADAVFRTGHDDYDLEPCVKRWNSPLKSSLNFKENMDCYSGSFETDLTHHLVEGYCKLHKTDEVEAGISMAAPSLEELRWRQRRHDCESAFLEATHLSNWTDRSAFSTDYFPVLRQISRSEVVRSDNSNKRGNRFYNYLRTLNINPSNSNIKTACDMFQ